MIKRKQKPLAPNPHGGIAKRAEERQRNRRLVEDWARMIIGRHAPELLSDTQNLLVTSKTVDTLVTILAARRSFEEISLGRSVLTSILRRGAEELGWDVKGFPDPIINIPRPPSPFRAESFARAAVVAEIMRRHEELLELPLELAQQGYPQSKPEMTDGKSNHRSGTLTIKTPEELLASRILFCAIASGGLLCRPLVTRLPEAMNTAMTADKEYIWIDFELPAETPDDRPACRRWFPDPVTSCLMLHWRLQGYTWPAGSHGQINRLIDLYLKHLGVSIKLISKEPSDQVAEKLCTVSFSGVDERVFNTHPHFRQSSTFEFLLDAAETRLRTKVPGVLVDFAVSLRAGTSLPSKTWWRTLLNQPLAIMPVASELETAGTHILDVVESWPHREYWNNHPGQLSTQRALARELQQCFGTGRNYLRPAQAVAALNAFDQRVQGDICPLLFALYSWARWCLTERRIGKGTLRARSVKRYISSIGIHLIELGGHLNPAKMSAEDFLELYDQVLTSIHSAKERTFAYDRLTEFHRFLQAAFDTPPLNWDEQTFERDGRSSPDANLITEAEFMLLIKVLDSWIEDERTREMLVLIMTIAYRLGLRRDEIAGLELSSVQGMSERGNAPRTSRPQLWVHTTSLSSVKGTASVRRIPLALLMHEKELARFFAWIDRRKREDGKSDEPNGLLFCQVGRPHEKLEDKGTFSLITAALRFVTGDPSMRFHHLRHSFITLLIGRLLSVSILAPTEALLPASWRGSDVLESNRLLKRFLRTEYPVRQMIYLVSAFAGHLDPQETTQTYCHCQDWLLGRHLAFDEQKLSLKLIAYLDGRTYTAVAAERSRKSSGLPGIEDVRRTLGRLIAKAQAAQPSIFIASPATTTLNMENSESWRPSRRDLLDFTLDEAYALTLTGMRTMPPAARAQLFDIPKSIITRFMRNAKSLADTRTATRNARGRRGRFLRYQGKSRKTPDPKQRPEISGLGVALPHESNERREAREVFRSLLVAYREKPELTRDLLNTFKNSVSRTDSELTISTEMDAKNLKSLFEVAGIGVGRIGVHVLSWPRFIKPGTDVHNYLADLFGIARKRVTVPNPLPHTKSASDFGRITISIAERTAGRSKLYGRRSAAKAASGWKIACFYATVVMNTASELNR